MKQDNQKNVNQTPILNYLEFKDFRKTKSTEVK